MVELIYGTIARNKYLGLQLNCFLLINSEVPVLEVWFYVSPSSSLSVHHLKFGITDLANKVRDLTPGSMDSVCKMPYIANNNVPLYFFMTLRIR